MIGFRIDRINHFFLLIYPTSFNIEEWFSLKNIKGKNKGVATTLEDYPETELRIITAPHFKRGKIRSRPGAVEKAFHDVLMHRYHEVEVELSLVTRENFLKYITEELRANKFLVASLVEQYRKQEEGHREDAVPFSFVCPNDYCVRFRKYLSGFTGIARKYTRVVKLTGSGISLVCTHKELTGEEEDALEAHLALNVYVPSDDEMRIKVEYLTDTMPERMTYEEIVVWWNINRQKYYDYMFNARNILRMADRASERKRAKLRDKESRGEKQ